MRLCPHFRATIREGAPCLLRGGGRRIGREATPPPRPCDILGKGGTGKWQRKEARGIGTFKKDSAGKKGVDLECVSSLLPFSPAKWLQGSPG